MARGRLLTITGIQDADLILSPAQRMKMLEAPSCFAFHVNNITTANASASSKLTRIHRKTGSLSARLVFETRAKCQEFVPRCKDDGTPFEVDSPFCDISTKITVRQSKSLEDLEIGKRCAPLWKTLATKLHEIFPERDTNDFFIVPVLDVRSQILSILDRKNGVFKLASPGHDSCSTLLLRVCAILAFLMVLRQVICQASHLAQNRTANV